MDATMVVVPMARVSTKLIASVSKESDNFGECVAIQGTRAVVGACGDGKGGFRSGAAHVYELKMELHAE